MSGRKYMLFTVGLILSVSVTVSAFTVFLISHYYSRSQFDLLNVICGEILEQDPEAEMAVSAALKECIGRGRVRNAGEYGAGAAAGNADRYGAGKMAGDLNSSAAVPDFLVSHGYCSGDFSAPDFGRVLLPTAAGLLAGLLLFTATFLLWNRLEAQRIQALAAYLEQVNMGKAAVLEAAGEDDFSKLEDEIYKTVTFLYQTRDAAVQAKNEFAENLSNIAHQIKTPITAISLAVQTMQAGYSAQKLEQIQRQLLRLTRLEEALLVLSRLDAGTLQLQKQEVDVFTVLVLAADNLQELLAESGVSVDIPEQGEVAVTADLEWTMEAVMNLMKNCMEHSRGGKIHCSYGENSLYTEILIRDEGEGFCDGDLPHLFERFYRGKNAGEGGIGIGLALAKEIIERQNGTIRAKNMPDGGACFEIRFYHH